MPEPDYSAYLNFYKKQGYIPYEELGNYFEGKNWVVHKDCPNFKESAAYRIKIVDEKPIATCWSCNKGVDPEAMERIRAEGKPVETPGYSCWWICQL